ncbi:hypothetical protein QNE73_004530 [Vibrio alginolyticus]|nr:hypothetical protein [Vibrio alginolyticus]
MDDKELQELSSLLRRRAFRARVAAWVSTVLIIGTVSYMIQFFYGDSVKLRDLKEQISHISGGSFTKADSKNDSDDSEAVKLAMLELELKRAEIDIKRAEIDRSSEEASRYANTITDSFTKVGAVIISVYLVQIMLSVMRYHFRLADHIDTVLESLIISKGDLEKLERTSNIIGVSHIDFGKAPQTPTDKVTQVLKELGDKISKTENRKE